MEQQRFDNQEVLPDLKTGKFPTPKQLELLKILNPFYGGKKIGYKIAALILGISHNAVASRMKYFRKRCPTLYANYCVACYPKKRKRPKKVIHETGCRGCGCDIPNNQELCFRCWKEQDRKARPKHYAADLMFPNNGVTSSTVDWDKWADNDYKFGNKSYRKDRY